ncbi:hypothetical protein [Streptomyces tailanensis]|uniref:hypothetical protein n=1 Tax=Streptomyces tailanensis TaxID=2569858 RepID=UPI00155A1445|nr:hypothetical protein [Streptomyces tailanensis]
MSPSPPAAVPASVYSTLYKRIPTLSPVAPIDQLAFNHTGTAYGVKCLPVTW